MYICDVPIKPFIHRSRKFCIACFFAAYKACGTHFSTPVSEPMYLFIALEITFHTVACCTTE